MNPGELKQKVKQVLWQQRYAVLATCKGQEPHSTIVSYAPADDLHSLIFPTPTTTRKFQNIQENPMVSFFVDDRSLEVDALRSIHGIEARGKAMEIKDEERRQYEHLYKSRYPELGNFARNTALIRISVERYDVVFNFQNVYILKMLDDQGQRMVLP